MAFSLSETKSNSQISSEFENSFIDAQYSALHSLVLRYHSLSSLGLSAEELSESSVREGARVLPFTIYKDVQIDILDASSLSATGTFKSIDACVVAAKAKKEGYRKCALASGGNTGLARALYCERLGIQTFWFYPQENERLIPDWIRDNSLIHPVGISDPGKVKQACSDFVLSNPDVFTIPTEWKVAAFEPLGGLIAEEILKTGHFDWISQTVSAGFAPLAYCRVLKRLYEKGVIRQLPRFIGTQQFENCFMYKAWKQDRIQEPIQSTDDLLLPVIFDTEPHTYNTREQFFRLLGDHQGELETISREEFANFEETFISENQMLSFFQARDVEIALNDGRIAERAGFVALAGVLKAIDRGTVAPGSRVLNVLSGGVRLRPEAFLRRI